MATYKIVGKRFLRKYTEPGTSPVYAAAVQAQRVVDNFCDVPWEPVRPRGATMTYHTDEVLDEAEGVTGLDKNVAIRDQFDAALFCAGHSGGQHRAYANAACYRYILPDEAVGETLESLSALVSSDPYNSEGARIHVFTNSTGEIPMNCHDCRGEDSSGDVVDDGTTAAGVAKRTVKTVSGTDYWYPTTETVTLEPTGGLTLQKYLFVVVALESYSTVRGNWLEGCSFIENKVSITTASAVDGWDDGDTIDLAGSDYVSILAGGTTPTWIEPPAMVDAGNTAPACVDFLRNRISVPFSVSRTSEVSGHTYVYAFSGTVQLVFNGTALESALLDWSLPQNSANASGQVSITISSSGAISPTSVGITSGTGWNGTGAHATLAVAYGVSLSPSAKTMVVSVELIPTLYNVPNFDESSGLSYKSAALVYVRASDASGAGAVSDRAYSVRNRLAVPFSAVDGDYMFRGAVQMIFNGTALESALLDWSLPANQGTAYESGQSELTVNSSGAIELVAVGKTDNLHTTADRASLSVSYSITPNRSAGTMVVTVDFTPTVYGVEKFATSALSFTSEGLTYASESAPEPDSAATYFDASAAVGDLEAVKQFGLAAAVADFTAAVSTFEASTSPSDGELLGRLVRMSKSGAGAMATLHPATAALAAELDALRPLPRFIRGGSAYVGTIGQPGLSAWYHRPTYGSAAAMGYAKANGATVLASVVLNPVFLQFALLALRSTGVLEEELVLSNASGASIHNDFKLRFVAWRSDAALWDKSNSFALAAFANLPSVYRSDGPGSVDWTVECSGSLFPFGTRQMSADRVGVSGVVSGDIADGEKIAIALDRPVGENDVILIAPEVVGFAATEAGDAYFGLASDPSDEVSGFVWARETYNIGWFPKIDGR